MYVRVTEGHEQACLSFPFPSGHMKPRARDHENVRGVQGSGSEGTEEAEVLQVCLANSVPSRCAR